jgi:predicted aspartyl protease
MRVFAVTVLLLLNLSLDARGRDEPVIPFVTDGRGAIRVAAMVGQDRVHFLIDTGSSRTVVAAGTVRRLHAPIVAKTELVTAAGSKWRLVARLDDVRVGAAHLPALLAAIVPDAALEPSGVEGILGHDFLGERRFLVDYSRRVVIWEPPAQAARRGNTVRLVRRDDRYLAALPQRDGSVLHLVPDSGSDMLVFFEQAAGVAIATLRHGARAQLASISGSIDSRAVIIPELRVGQNVFRHQPAVIIRRDLPGTDGLLSLGLFRQVLFDGRNETMTVWR